MGGREIGRGDGVRWRGGGWVFRGNRDMRWEGFVRDFL